LVLPFFWEVCENFLEMGKTEFFFSNFFSLLFSVGFLFSFKIGAQQIFHPKCLKE
jgi:hypothetical protein